MFQTRRILEIVRSLRKPATRDVLVYARRQTDICLHLQYKIEWKRQDTPVQMETR